MKQPVLGIFLGYAIPAALFVVMSLIAGLVSFLDNMGTAQRRKVENSAIGLCAGIIWPVSIIILSGWGAVTALRRVRSNDSTFG